VQSCGILGGEVIAAMAKAYTNVADVLTARDASFVYFGSLG
jgi:hypothetical protein